MKIISINIFFFVPKTLRWPLVTACIVVLLSVGSSALAQEYEYEADEGLHQEEWYDPSDWFDNDTGVSYESDWNDYYYGYDSYDPWYDDSYVYDPDYGYDYDDGYAYDYWYEDDYGTRYYGVGPAYGDPIIDDTSGYYTEDWYDDDAFNEWYDIDADGNADNQQQ